MHRIGSGQKIENIEAARATWFAENRTVSTFCNKAEWEAWQEDTGELVEALDGGTEIRQHATLKTHSRGGSRKIVHNCVIEGNPTAYALYEADPRPSDQKGWMGQWTYYPSRDLDHVLQIAKHGFPV
jgi:hypothetical protein